MNRVEFLTELERLLSGMPEDERQAAVQYYADYLADAGEENEAEAIRELGSPEKVAESIKADYYGESGQTAQNTAQNGSQTDAKTATLAAEQTDAGEKKEPWTNNWLKLLLIALIVIVAGPVAVGVASAILGLIIGVIAFFVSLVIAAVAVAVSGLIVIFAGLALMVMPAAALVVIGIGILLFVLGLMATVGMVKLCMIVFPAMLRGFVDLCRRPFHRKAVS